MGARAQQGTQLEGAHAQQGTRLQGARPLDGSAAVACGRWASLPQRAGVLGRTAAAAHGLLRAAAARCAVSGAHAQQGTQPDGAHVQQGTLLQGARPLEGSTAVACGRWAALPQRAGVLGRTAAAAHGLWARCRSKVLGLGGARAAGYTA